MAERPPEQESAEDRIRDFVKLNRTYGRKDIFSYRWLVVEDLAVLLAAYEDRSKENKELREGLEKLSYDFAAKITAIRARAAADCVRLEGERDAREAKLRGTIIEARRELWWFVERDTGEGWGWDEADVDEIAPRAMRIQDEVLAAGLAALSSAEAEDEQHAHAEHLREAREVEQHQEEKHGE